MGYLPLCAGGQEMLGLPHFLGLDIRCSGTVLFFSNPRGSTVHLLISFQCSLVLLASFRVFLFLRRCKEKRFYPTLSDFEVLCTILLFCTMGVTTEYALWGYRIMHCLVLFQYLVIFYYCFLNPSQLTFLVPS